MRWWGRHRPKTFLPFEPFRSLETAFPFSRTPPPFISSPPTKPPEANAPLSQCLAARLPKLQSNARSYTNRHRRESRSQAGTSSAPKPPHPNPSQPPTPLPPHLLHTGGVPGLGPVTTMGMISPVEEEFHVGHNNNTGMAPASGPGMRAGHGRGHGQSFAGAERGDRRSAEMMPPPPPPMMVPLGAAAGVQFGGYMNGRRTRGGRGSRRAGGGGGSGVAAAPAGVGMGSPGDGAGSGWQPGQGQSQQELGGYADQGQGQGEFNPWGPPGGDPAARRG